MKVVVEECLCLSIHQSVVRLSVLACLHCVCLSVRRFLFTFFLIFVFVSLFGESASPSMQLGVGALTVR